MHSSIPVLLWLSLISTLASEQSSVSVAADHTATQTKCLANADRNMQGRMMAQLKRKNKMMDVVPEADYNCTEGAVKNWTEDKVDWCCVNEFLGCGFNCSAGYSRWKKDWPQLKKYYCCQNELIGCTFNCSEDLFNMRPSWLPIKKAWCCKAEGTGCKEEEEKDKRPCLTQENVLARSSMFGGHVSPAGTPCVFGINPSDEGYHCILDKGLYGSFGWCYTNKDRSSWGACNQDCPLFGLAKIIGNRLKTATEDLGDRLKHLEGQLRDPQKGGPKSVAAGKVPASSVSANGTAASGNSTNSEGNATQTQSGKKATETSTKSSTNKDVENGAKKGAKEGLAKDSKKDPKKVSKKDSKQGKP